MEYGSIEREIRIDAAPEIIFTKAGEKVPVAFQVVDAVPYRLFSFRWTHPEGAQAREYRDHCAGWDYHLSRLAPYVVTYLGADR